MFESLDLTLSDVSHLMIDERKQNEKGSITMLKYVKKTKLIVRDGIVVNKKGKIKNIDPVIVTLANELEDLVQRKRYENSVCCCECSKESKPEFGRIHEGQTFKVEADTPTLDEAVKRCIKIMCDIDREEGAKQMNKMLDHFRMLLQFAASEEVIVGFDCDVKLDTPVIGNIFDLTVDDVYDALAFVCDGIAYDDEDIIKE